MKHKRYYTEYNFREYAFLVSPDGDYAIKIKYKYPFNEWYAWGTATDIYCVDLREEFHNKVRYIGTWDWYFDTDIIPEQHYKMKWSPKGGTMVVQSGDYESPIKFEIEWDRVFGG